MEVLSLEACFCKPETNMQHNLPAEEEILQLERLETLPLFEDDDLLELAEEFDGDE